MDEARTQYCRLIIIIINFIFYSAFQGTSQSALHKRKDWEKTIITIKSKIKNFHMTQKNHLKAILKKYVLRTDLKTLKDSACLISEAREFQSFGAQDETFTFS